MFSISFTNFRDEKITKQLVHFDQQNVNIFARAIITSTAHASFVFLPSYGNTI